MLLIIFARHLNTQLVVPFAEAGPVPRSSGLLNARLPAPQQEARGAPGRPGQAGRRVPGQQELPQEDAVPQDVRVRRVALLQLVLQEPLL